MPNEETLKAFQDSEEGNILVGPVSIVFTVDIRFKTGWQVIGEIENHKGYKNGNEGYCESK